MANRTPTYNFECPKCGKKFSKDFLSEWDHRNFKGLCSRKCANSHYRSLESKEKTSAALYQQQGVANFDGLLIPLLDGTRTVQEIGHLLGLRVNIVRHRVIRLGLKKNLKTSAEVNLNEILQGLHPSYSRSALKTKLLNRGIKKNQCEVCGRAEEGLNCHLDHINGVSNDHRLENLQMLCPNCHSKTSTYAGRNKQVAGVARLDQEILELLHQGSTTSDILKTLNLNRSSANYKRLKRLQDIYLFIKSKF